MGTSVNLDTSDMKAVAAQIIRSLSAMKDELNKVDSSQVSTIRQMKGGRLLISLIETWDEIKNQLGSDVVVASDQSSKLITAVADEIDDFFGGGISVVS